MKNKGIFSRFNSIGNENKKNKKKINFDNKNLNNNNNNFNNNFNKNFDNFNNNNNNFNKNFDNNNNNFNNTNSNLNYNTNNNNNFPFFDINNLLENEKDSYESLKTKNKNLRKLIIQTSNKFIELSKKFTLNENLHQSEKNEILKQLDKISNNYKLYAKSHQENLKLKNDFKELEKKFNQNNKVINNLIKTVENLLSDYIIFYKKITKFLKENKNNENDFSENSFYFLENLKEIIQKHTLKYKKEIDAVNFAEIYEEFDFFIKDFENNNKKINLDVNNNIFKKKHFSIRKKEYFNNNTFDNNENEIKNKNENKNENNKKYNFNKKLLLNNNNNNNYYHNHNKSFDVINNSNKKNEVFNDFKFSFSPEKLINENF